MALRSLGGGYGAAIKNRRQGEYGESTQGKLSKGTQAIQEQASRYANSRPIETFDGLK
jgi:hypothetical protein